MTKNQQMTVDNAVINVTQSNDDDYISLTDMLKAKDGDFFISDWLRNRNTIEFLGVWEQMHNQNFNYGEFAIIKSQAGLNSYKISIKEWRQQNPKAVLNNENIRDIASINELTVLSTLEAINSNMIKQGIDRQQRLNTLREMAQDQLLTLNRISDDKKSLKKIKKSIYIEDKQQSDTQFDKPLKQ